VTVEVALRLAHRPGLDHHRGQGAIFRSTLRQRRGNLSITPSLRPAMHIRLSELRAACASDPFVSRVIAICAVTRQLSLTRFAWVQRQREARFGPESFKELLHAFQALERCGFGRILQGSQRARARFQWAVMPVTIERALNAPGKEILPAEVLPVAAELGLSLPPPEVAATRPGWGAMR
jgi:hypothetical protein